jgi:hypothetical protein
MLGECSGPPPPKRRVPAEPRERQPLEDGAAAAASHTGRPRPSQRAGSGSGPAPGPVPIEDVAVEDVEDPEVAHDARQFDDMEDNAEGVESAAGSELGDDREMWDVVGEESFLVVDELPPSNLEHSRTVSQLPAASSSSRSGPAASSSSGLAHAAPPPLPPPPVPPVTVETADPPSARGWKRSAAGSSRTVYEGYDIFSLDGLDTFLGTIKVNDQSSSLDVHCQVCKGKRNRTFLRQNHRTGRGRPLGSHLAWLQLCPRTSPGEHESLYRARYLPFDDRSVARLAYAGMPELDPLFDREHELGGPEEAEEPLQFY